MANYYNQDTLLDLQRENAELKEKLFSMTSLAREHKQLWKEACKERNQLHANLAAMESQEPEPYDAGFLNDFGGGNVSWWHDYMRSELGRAHDHYAQQFIVPADNPAVAVLDEISQNDSCDEFSNAYSKGWNDCIRSMKVDEPQRAKCETCAGAGHYDERLGGEFFSNPRAECPDCNGTGEQILAADPSHSHQSADPVARAHVTLTDSWPVVYLEILDGSFFQAETVDLFSKQAQAVVFEWPKPITIYEGLDEPHNYYRPSQIAEALDKAGITKRIKPHAPSDRCPSHESEQSIDDLPGMWDESDLSGGWADSCNQQTEGD